MVAQQSSQQPSQPHQRPMGGRLPRWLLILFIIAFVLAVLSFIGATIFWFGLVHDKLPDALGAVFTGSGTIFSFVALIIGIPPFIQYLRERQVAALAASLSINDSNLGGQTRLIAQQSSVNLGDMKNSPPPNPPQLTSPDQTNQQSTGSATDRLTLQKILSRCNPTIFENVIFRLAPEPGILIPENNSQGKRAIDLLKWAENDGPGLEAVKEAYLIESGKKKTQTMA